MGQHNATPPPINYALNGVVDKSESIKLHKYFVHDESSAGAQCL